MLSRSAPVGLILCALLALASCTSKSETAPAVAGTQSAPSSSYTPTVEDPLDGSAWRSTYSCDEARKNLEAAGLQQYSTKVLGDCHGVQHGYIAFSNGLVTWSPSQAGVAYQILNHDTFIENYERYSFRIEGDRAFFEGHIVKALYPYSRTEMRGEEAVDVAGNGFPMERVG